MCVNLMWQTCAIKGLLHGQGGGRQMRFSIAPAALDTALFRNPPKGCVNGDCGNGYAVSDVYYAEVCVMSHSCRNREALFRLRVGELFVCDFDETAFLGSVSLGSVLPAVGRGTVVAANSKKFKVGSRVMGMLGAQEYAKLSAAKEGMAAEVYPAMTLPGGLRRAVRTGIATPSSRRRGDGVENDATIQHESAVKF